MKANFTLLMLCLGLSAIFVSCEKDKAPSSDDQAIEATFKGNIHIPTTKAHDGQWDSNDDVGISMMNTQGDNIVNGIYNYDYYTSNGSETFTPRDQAKTIFLPQNGSQVTFKGYYPYLPSLGNDLVIPVDVIDQNHLPVIDLMTSEETTTYDISSSTIQLNFHHRLVKAVFIINAGSGLSIDIPALTMTIQGTKTSGTYNLMSGTPDFASGSVSNITVPTVGQSNTRTAIILPREAGPGVFFVFESSSGEKYIANMASGLELQAGYQYTFNITLQTTPVTVGATITPWDDSLPAIDLNALLITGNIPGSIDVPNGTVMEVFREITGGTRVHLANFTYSLTNGLWTPDVPVSWENLENPTTFYAWIKDHDKWNPSQLDDYLTATPATVGQFQNIVLNLSHPAAMVTVQLSSSDGSFSTTELENMTVLLPDYYVGGTYNTGVFTTGTVIGGTQDIITLYRDVSNNTLSAVIDPQIITAGSTVATVRTAAGLNYYAQAGVNVGYEAGKVTILNIDMTKTTAALSARIVDWVAGQNVTMIAKGITIGGTLDNNSDFFINQTIRAYQLTPLFRDVPYTYSHGADGRFHWQGPILYWDDQPNQEINATAFYFPSQQDPTPGTIDQNTIAFPWNLPTDQSNGYANYDLLSSTVSLTTPQYINFKFTHTMSKAVVKLNAQDFTSAELVGATVTLTNVILNGRVTMTTGRAGTSGAVSSVLMHPDTSGEQYSALVMPTQSISQGTNIVAITLPGYQNETFIGTYNQVQALSFTPGKTTLITVTLQKTGIQLSAQYQDWTAGDSGTIIIE